MWWVLWSICSIVASGGAVAQVCPAVNDPRLAVNMSQPVFSARNPGWTSIPGSWVATVGTNVTPIICIVNGSVWTPENVGRDLINTCATLSDVARCLGEALTRPQQSMLRCDATSCQGNVTTNGVSVTFSINETSHSTNCPTENSGCNLTAAQRVVHQLSSCEGMKDYWKNSSGITTCWRTQLVPQVTQAWQRTTSSPRSFSTVSLIAKIIASTPQYEAVATTGEPSATGYVLKDAMEQQIDYAPVNIAMATILGVIGVASVLAVWLGRRWLWENISIAVWRCLLPMAERSSTWWAWDGEEIE